GSGSSSNSSKNLSHVPCKFYKQGICQAGNSCPFSHNLDGTLAADKLPCKYFQKGNCKFGLKCALAHFLPD
ncbi:zinc finger protein, partial [Scheffersomyces stipitis CBS 6054]